MNDKNKLEKFGFSLKLRETRYRRYFTQKEFAKMIGISYNTYRSYEYDRAKPSIETIQKIAIALNVSVDYLFELSTESNPHKTRKECMSDNEWKLTRLRIKKARERSKNEEWMKNLTRELFAPEE